MKIIYGITKSNFGGAQRYVFDLASRTKKAGHEVKVICGGDGALIKKLEQDDIDVIPLPSLKRDISLVEEWRSFLFIYRTLMKERPEIFHTNSSKMGGLGNYAARMAGVEKIIFTAHGWEFNAPRPWWQRAIIRFFSWVTILLSTHTICVSNKTCEDVKNLPLVQRKLSVIQNGIENFPLMERGSARKALGIHDEETLVIGTLSELHPVKGLDILLDAFEKFLRKNDATLVLIGTGELRENLENYAESLGIRDKVMFRGYMEDARKYLPALDIFCLPSRSEAMPYVILEAGVAARPVIASGVGGVPEIVENGLNGVVIPPEDSETLFSSLLLLANDKILRERLGNALKETVETNFSSEKMAGETFALY